MIAIEEAAGGHENVVPLLHETRSELRAHETRAAEHANVERTIRHARLPVIVNPEYYWERNGTSSIVFPRRTSSTSVAALFAFSRSCGSAVTFPLFTPTMMSPVRKPF